MKKLDKTKLPPGTSTHIRLFSGDVKNFNLHQVQEIESKDDYYCFGFTMKRNLYPRITLAITEDDDNECAVLLDKDGLESLIAFLNMLCEEK